MRAVLASDNQGKLAELSTLLAPAGIQLHAQGEFSVQSPEETGLSFVENALLKARYAARHTGLAALADDSGLVVPSLDGEPGLYSARYAGAEASDAENIIKLNQRLAAEPQASRHAYFICLLVFLRHAEDPAPLIAEGRWHGEIIDTPRGTHGFGYDPVFYLPELGLCAAQMPKAQKAEHSHRAIAVSQLLQRLPEVK